MVVIPDRRIDLPEQLHGFVSKVLVRVERTDGVVCIRQNRFGRGDLDIGAEIMSRLIHKLNIIDAYEMQETVEWTRVCEELKAFEERGMEDLLRYMIYLVDFMRENDIVWGVGRGSSVASYVLYLIGVHRIDSIKYNTADSLRIFAAYSGSINLTREDGPYDIAQGMLTFREITGSGSNARIKDGGEIIKVDDIYILWDTEDQP